MTTEPATTGLAATEPATTGSARTDPVRGGEDGTPLTLAGWHPGRDAGDAAMIAVLKTTGPGPWSLFPAAERAVREFHGLRPAPAAHGGREVAATGCVVDPQEARYSGPPLHRLAETLGTRLFPLGRTDADAPMAVDEEGRLFSLGAGGAWLHGETVRDGLLALTEGLRPYASGDGNGGGRCGRQRPTRPPASGRRSSPSTSCTPTACSTPAPSACGPPRSAGSA
ncbi:SUKH-3 domain-containing protein [Streptomyces sp. TLI_105]|uniref:SUKH-3 domain-containing protein n=1 Tax=Streptomyces sp. TLI_105 TaxID=1881019 RepID=UPI0008979C93|nr:SUKH-3 domain-containing protein [Streptomyces sp. TLI_105]SEC13966.1 SUKH-3 immunity protein [Streptomyces sp. TLI_105]